jgi:excisionase family DNA binding protein
MSQRVEEQPTHGSLTEPLLNADEAAQLLHVPRSTLYELVRSRHLPHVRVGRAFGSRDGIWLSGCVGTRLDRTRSSLRQRLQQFPDRFVEKIGFFEGEAEKRVGFSARRADEKGRGTAFGPSMTPGQGFV